VLRVIEPRSAIAKTVSSNLLQRLRTTGLSRLAWCGANAPQKAGGACLAANGPIGRNIAGGCYVKYF